MQLGGFPHRQGWWLPRMIRGARLDRNPLRRVSDRIQTCVLAGLFVALVAAAPFLVFAASHSSYVDALQARNQQQATRHKVSAVLTEEAPPISGYSMDTGVPTSAEWTSAAGVHRTGLVSALPGTAKGRTVQIWTDDSTGNPDVPPLTLAEAAGQADATMVGAIAGIGVAYVAGAGLVVYVLNRRRMAAWEAGWRVTEPAWNRQQRW